MKIEIVLAPAAAQAVLPPTNASRCVELKYFYIMTLPAYMKIKLRANQLTLFSFPTRFLFFLGLLPATTSTRDSSAPRVPAVVVVVVVEVAVVEVAVVEAAPRARDVRPRLLISLMPR